MSNRLDFRLLRQYHLLAEIIDAGSMSRAAKKLGLTQPALAEQINLLEQELGAELIYRTTRGVTPTETAMALLPRIREFSTLATDFTDQAARICSEGNEVIRIGVIFEAMLRTVPELKRTLAKRFPTMDLRTAYLDSSDAEEALLARRIDIAIGFFDLFVDERIMMKSLLSERPVLAVPESHPLAGTGETTLDEFRHEKWVAIEDSVSRNYVKKLEVFLKRHGIRPEISQTAPSILSQLGLVACGEGVALVPETFRSVLPPGVSALDLTDAQPLITLSAAWDNSRESETRDRVLAILMRQSPGKA
ncbi:LysR family transcriptional regulator [Sutterella sp.]|uniref:LysR family transcriptional regulator n=1 Tax=Sutterella sp. TaxID=1981025 RepID=UPI0026DFFF13|nr:LysR family transcriptional regulator [Sutterella sp.]MDO5532362.1 LysR family transcriptional regulator [Sutterella sp.]